MRSCAREGRGGRRSRLELRPASALNVTIDAPVALEGRRLLGEARRSIVLRGSIGAVLALRVADGLGLPVARQHQGGAQQSRGWPGRVA